MSDPCETPDEGASSRAFYRGHDSVTLTNAQHRRTLYDSLSCGCAGGFGSTSDDISSHVCVDSEDDENDDPFASIVDFLDRREKVLDLKSDDDVSKQHTALSGSQGEAGDSHLQNRQNNCSAARTPNPFQKTCNLERFVSGDDHDLTAVRNLTGFDKFPKDFKDSSTHENSRPSINSQSINRKRQYSVVKNTTPRFTFSQKPEHPFITPSAKKTLPPKVLFPPSSSTLRSQKRQKRHTFRPTADVSVNSVASTDKNNRNEDFVPSFISRSGKSSSVARTSKEKIQQDDDEDDNLVFRYTHNALRRSKRDSIASSGYLTKRLHSLRANNQVMNMRLHSEKLSTPSLISRTRRRGGGNATSPRNDATTVLDVTVCENFNLGCVNVPIFGDSKRAVIAYIHSYKTLPTEKKQPNRSSRFPCFSWIILSQDMLQKRRISDARPVQLRIYDAIVIQPRSADGDPKENIPTIICAHVYEEYPSALPPLPMVSFDVRF